jgi:hypothetical protein
VLIAMSVMAVGAAAVMTMQKASIQGNLDARKLDVANGIARMWQERLEADAMAWTQPNAGAPGVTNLSTTNGALIAHGLATANRGQWYYPSDYIINTTTPESYYFDILGRDLKVNDVGSAVFCVAVRLTPLVAGSIATAPALVRADVRVLWLRGLGSSPPSGQTFCGDGSDALQTIIPNEGTVYHSLYVTSALRENPAQ